MCTSHTILKTIHLNINLWGFFLNIFFFFSSRDPLDLSASRKVQTYVTSVLDCLDHCNNMYKFLQWLAFPFHVKRSHECLPAGASEQDHCFTAFTSDVAQWCCLKTPILGNKEESVKHTENKAVEVLICTSPQPPIQMCFRRLFVFPVVPNVAQNSFHVLLSHVTAQLRSGNDTLNRPDVLKSAFLQMWGTLLY